MVNFKKICAMSFALVMLLSLAVFTASADTLPKSDKDLEVVFLFDVSGSMDAADRENANGTRSCIEGANSFVMKCSTGRNLYVKIVPYNQNVYRGFESVNVSTKDGFEKLQKQIQNILRDKSSDIIPGIDCWDRFGDTDIGEALDYAVSYLKSSRVTENKAVILFTDGKIDITEGERLSASDYERAAEKFGVSELDIRSVCADKRFEYYPEVESYYLSMSAFRALSEDNIDIISVAFDGSVDANGNSGIDRAFLRSISSNWTEPKNYPIVNYASDIIGLFDKICDRFVVVPNANPTSVKISETEEAVTVLKVYDNATRSVNFNISSTARLKTVKVTDPLLRTQEIDLDHVGFGVKEYKTFRLNISTSYQTVSVVLDSPMGGEWVISATGDRGTAITQTVYMYDLDVATLPVADKHYIGDTLEVTATYYNSEIQREILDKSLIEDSKDASVYLVVTDENDNTIANLKGAVSETGTGYDFEYTFNKPGVYSLEVELNNPLVFEGEGRRCSEVNTIEVLSPIVDVTESIPENNDTSRNRVYTLSLKNPLTDEAVSDVPDGIKNDTVKLSIKGEDSDVRSIKMSEFKNGEYTLDYTFKTSGEYTVDLISCFGGKEAVVKTLSSFIKPSEISMISSLPDAVYHGRFFDKAAYHKSFIIKIDISNAFRDADGDPIFYRALINGSEASEDGDGNVLAEIKDIKDDDGSSVTALIVSFSDYGKADVTILATDNNNAKATHTITFRHTSGWGYLICIIAAVILVFAFIILLIARSLPKKISKNFNLQIYSNEKHRNLSSYNLNLAAYNVGNRITLKDLLWRTDISGEPRGLRSEDIAANDEAVRCASEIVITGTKGYGIKIKASGNNSPLDATNTYVAIVSRDGRFIYNFYGM